MPKASGMPPHGAKTSRVDVIGVASTQERGHAWSKERGRVAGLLKQDGASFAIPICDTPTGGWLVTATTPDSRVIKQQFLVALDDAGQAIAAVAQVAHPPLLLAVGPRVECEHFVRRNMKLGDVYELGWQRIGRGKNLRR